MTQGFNLELDKELEVLLDQWEETRPISPESISQVLVIWNYWEYYLSGIKESSNSFFDDGFEFVEDLNEFILGTFRVEVIDESLLKFIWDHQWDKYRNKSQQFLN